MPRRIVYSAAVLVTSLVCAASATASRPPTPEEKAELEAAAQRDLQVGAGYFTLSEVRVSDIAPWAVATLNHPYRGADLKELGLFRKHPTKWKLEDSGSAGICIGPDLSALGMPAAVGRDLELGTCRGHAHERQKILVQRGPGSGEELFYRPHVFYLSGDGAFFINKVRWKHYDGKVATATATANTNDCVPFCAEGHFSRHPAKVRLTRPIHCVNSYIDAYLYTRIYFSIPGRVPGNFPHRGSVSLRPVNEYGKPVC